MSCADNSFESRADGFQHCSHCGSVSITDAIKILKQPGTRFSGSDWKYGWPHKFYLEPLNPAAEELVEVGCRSSDGSKPGDYWTCFAHGERPTCGCSREPHATGYWSSPIMGHYERLYCKFYNAHLATASEDELKEFAELANKIFGIEFGRNEKGVWYKAPHSKSGGGFQLYGIIGSDGEPRFGVQA